MGVSRLQHTEIPLYAPAGESERRPAGRLPSLRRPGVVVIEPAGRPRHSEIQIMFNLRGLQLYRLSPEEAHTIGASLVEHALECGYDPDTDETTPLED